MNKNLLSLIIFACGSVNAMQDLTQNKIEGYEKQLKQVESEARDLGADKSLSEMTFWESCDKPGLMELKQKYDAIKGRQQIWKNTAELEKGKTLEIKID